jgi:hypothetical protein
MVVARVSFERKPKMPTVVIEAYLNFIYLIDMIRIFLTPIKNKDELIVFSYRAIALNYIKGWFFFDLFAFIPLGLIRKNSVWEEGSKNE